MISIGHEFLNTQNKNYSRNIIHYRITRIVKEIYMGIKGKQKIKIIKNAYGKKFHRLENPRISFYQKKGKVDSPYSLLERICDFLNLGASILILCSDLKVWIAHQSIWISWSGSEGLQGGNAKEAVPSEKLETMTQLQQKKHFVWHWGNDQQYIKKKKKIEKDFRYEIFSIHPFTS